MFLFETESANAQFENRGVYLHGVAIKSEVVNKNNRFYPRHILESGLESLNEKIKSGSAYGSFGHPTSTETDSTRISHIVESLRRRGNDWHCRSRVIDEGCGKILQSVLRARGNVGYSSRSSGSTKKHGDHELVQEGLTVHTIDVVQDPSIGTFAKALHESILNESFNAEDTKLAIKLLKESKYPTADDNYYSDLFRGHKAFNLPDDGKTHLERLNASEEMVLNKLRTLSKEIQLSDPGLSSETFKTYLQSTRDPIERAKITREFMSNLKNARMRLMAMDALARASRFNS
jgi:hypothetical protein